jgi:hypothetical protein
MFGWNVDVEPVTEFSVFVVEPVIDEFELEVEPVTLGLTVLVPDALADGETLLEVDALVEAWSSGMQSMWTGLCECSFAWPVSLFASLPACGWPRLLQSGFVASAVVALLVVLRVVLALGAAFEVLSDTEDLLVVCASAGVAPMTAAAITLRVNGRCFILQFLLVRKKRDMHLWDRKAASAVAFARKNRGSPTAVWPTGHTALVASATRRASLARRRRLSPG